MNQKSGRHFFASGRVQGVFYRRFCLDQARKLGLKGWAKNLDDGRVEVMAYGDLKALQSYELKLKSDQGKRYSPGYPLWRDLEDQVKIFKILQVEKNIGIKLTSSFQMVPEQSTTAMVLHSELAEY